VRKGGEPYDFSSLRFLASVGEPLNPEAVVWSEKVFGQPFHDNWWQTETGGIMIANRPGMEVRPGSMGKPLPGIEAGIVGKTEDRSCANWAPARSENWRCVPAGRR
jgi:acetyl-CoA synthetase